MDLQQLLSGNSTTAVERAAIADALAVAGRASATGNAVQQVLSLSLEPQSNTSGSLISTAVQTAVAAADLAASRAVLAASTAVNAAGNGAGAAATPNPTTTTTAAAINNRFSLLSVTVAVMAAVLL
ncbi:uncharacterized protein ACO6RY_01914 [Pungitius sinensis]